MSDPPPLDPARPTPEQLEREIRACDRYEADWRAGKRPQIESFLIEVPEPSRPSLLHKLIGLEVELRADHGERPTQEEYRARFPEHGEWIGALFVEMNTPGGNSGEGSDAVRGDTAGTLHSTGLRFRILRPHAEGGLGVVYVALDGELNREVALKEIRARFAHDTQYRSRFLAEAEITGRLEHPGIVPIYGLGRSDDDRPFYAMRLIVGESLKEAIARLHRPDGPGPDPTRSGFELRQLLRRFVDVCNAVAYAHSRGVLHRDLKPANIMLGKYGETIVVDWGLAKAVGQSVADAVPDDQVILVTSPGAAIETNPGSVTGTPAFMSPEQAVGQNESLGPASDVYSLGATLYQLLTGRAAFEDRDPAQLIEKVSGGRFPRPRLVGRDVHPALEAICLKAMALKPEDRYGSARFLGDDVERWLADEPVSAWSEPWSVRTRRWAVRHRTPVASATAALAVALMAGAFFVHESRLRAARRLGTANGHVDALEAAEIRAVPRIVEELRPDRHLVLVRLRAMTRDESVWSKHSEPPLMTAFFLVGTGPRVRVRREAHRRRLHASLALLPGDPTQVNYLGGRLLWYENHPDELFVIRQALWDRGYAPRLTPQLWDLLDAGTTDFTNQQLCVAGALAGFDPQNPRWSSLAGPLAAKLVQENLLLAGAWREVFQPLSRMLIPHLRAIYRDRGRSEDRALAFSLLVEFATRPGNPNQPEELAELVADADPRQYLHIISFMPKMAPFTARLESKLDGPARFDVESARRQGRVATALLTLGHADRVWPLLKHSDEPSLRTELVHDLKKYYTQPGLILSRLRTETAVSARRALILALGELPVVNVLEVDRRAWTTELLRAFRVAGDPGLHSAIDRLLRHKWDKVEELDRIDGELSAPGVPEGRDWFVNTQSQTMAIVRGPIEFLMGSPKGEAGRQADELQHRVRVERSFAISTREVTVAQYARFLDESPDVLRIHEDEQAGPIIPSLDCPIIGVDWFDAARYCNWLSRREGIPEDQWCYPEEVQPGMALPPDYLRRSGYRLPTEAEWEYACRAGSAASRPHGESEELLPHYGWCFENSGNRTHPVGQLMPNDLGLFDMLGNAYEWTQDPYLGPYRVDLEGGVTRDEEHHVRASADVARVLRGGGFLAPAAGLRSAYRTRFEPTQRDVTIGFRPARTLP